MKELDSKVQNKISIQEIEEILKEKLDIDAFTEAMQLKASVHEIDWLNNQIQKLSGAKVEEKEWK